MYSISRIYSEIGKMEQEINVGLALFFSFSYCPLFLCMRNFPPLNKEKTFLKQRQKKRERTTCTLNLNFDKT